MLYDDARQTRTRLISILLYRRPTKSCMSEQGLESLQLSTNPYSFCYVLPISIWRYTRFSAFENWFLKQANFSIVAQLKESTRSKIALLRKVSWCDVLGLLMDERGLVLEFWRRPTSKLKTAAAVGLRFSALIYIPSMHLSQTQHSPLRLWDRSHLVLFAASISLYSVRWQRCLNG